MTLDSSALVALLFSEPGYRELVDRMLEADTLRVGAPTLVETSLVFESRLGRRQRPAGRDDPSPEVHALVRELGVTVVPFGEAEWHRAADAFVRYGRGRHKANLNFGDCLAYATAAAAGDSLLFVGSDFKHTDLPAA
ncbi:MAG TPA: type II toxin-antitoxin system VapC family toxin [Vicinamibacterales bacterium]|nr:type II toxin-antitoxin system VapC family toxin [Vicinamibacterales bacterium]